MSTNPPTDVPVVAGFWQRLGAFVLDVLLLGLVGAALGLFFTDELVHLGSWGRLLGFSVALAYFGLLDSKVTGGQTLGKRLFGIKVVSRTGAPLSLPKSFMRFLPLGAAWFLNDAHFPVRVLFSAWGYVLSIAIFGIGSSIIYLYIFNRRSRQSLHDLLVGSYVISSSADDPLTKPRLWAGHVVVCVLLVVASGVIPYFTRRLAVRQPFASLLKVSRAANAKRWVMYSQASQGKTSLAVTACLRDPDIANAARANQLANLVLSKDSAANDLDTIGITLAYGYDIGIASSWRSRSYVHSPAQWVLTDLKTKDVSSDGTPYADH